MVISRRSRWRWTWSHRISNSGSSSCVCCYIERGERVKKKSVFTRLCRIGVTNLIFKTKRIRTHSHIRGSSKYGCFGNRRSWCVDIFSEFRSGKPDDAEYWKRRVTWPIQKSLSPISCHSKEVVANFDQKTVGRKKKVALKSSHKPNHWVLSQKAQ